MSTGKSKSDAAPADGPQSLLGETGQALIYPPVLAATGSLLLGMFGTLFTLDLPAAVDGLGFLLMGVFVQAPLLGIGAGLVVMIGLAATIPLHKKDLQWVWGIALPVAVGVGLAWCVVKILLTGVEMTFWAGIVGAVLGGIAGLVVAISSLTEIRAKRPKVRAGRSRKL